MWRGKPRCTAASMSASMTRKTYVGPVPLTAVAMATSFSSSTSSCSPRLPSSDAAWSRCASVTSGVAYQTVMPRPSWAGVLGMLRTIWRWRSTLARAVVRGAGDDADDQLAVAQRTAPVRGRRGAASAA